MEFCSAHWNYFFELCSASGLEPSEKKLTSSPGTITFSPRFILLSIIANEPAERRRSAGEAAENSAARRMAYAKKFSIEL